MSVMTTIDTTPESPVTTRPVTTGPVTTPPVMADSGTGASGTGASETATAAAETAAADAATSDPSTAGTTGPAPVIRHYDPGDEEAVIELWRRTWQTAYPRFDFAARVPWWRERWRTELLPIASVVVADVAGEAGPEILGFVTIEESGYLDQIVVAPEAWGTPVATALLDEAKRIVPTGIALHVNKDNVRAIRFYEKQGFSIGGEDVNPRSQSPVFMMVWRP